MTKMTKIVINLFYGGFDLSPLGKSRYLELSGKEFSVKVPRYDPDLVRVVEELGKAAIAKYSPLCIQEVPSGSQYRITEYDGYETLETPDTIDWETAP